MKKSLILLFIAASFISSCKKDSISDPNVPPVVTPTDSTLQHVWSYKYVVKTHNGVTSPQDTIHSGETWNIKSTTELCKSYTSYPTDCFLINIPNSTTILVHATLTDEYKVVKIDGHNMWLKFEDVSSNFYEVRKFTR